MTSKRVKASAFESRSEFQQALDDVAAMSVELRTIEAERDAKLQEIQEAYNDDVIDIKKKIKGLVAQAEKFALAHRSELFVDGKKSGETSLALFGFRTGNPTLVLLNKKWSWETVVNALIQSPFMEYVITKSVPDKDALKAKLTDAELASVGCRISQDEAFWVEPKLDTSL